MCYNNTEKERKILNTREENKMIDTGVVRRIDDIGRIVIPKELRRVLGFKEGTPLTFSIDKGKLVLELYETREVKIEKWIEKVEDRMEHCNGKLIFKRSGNVTVCLYYSKCSCVNLDNVSVGVAVCAPDDEYNERFGRALAFARMANVCIPDFIYEED